MDQRRRLGASPHPKCADRLGSVNFVRGDRDEVWAVWNLESAKSLHRIAKHQSTGLMRHRRNLGDGLDDANLIVDQHDRDDGDVVTQNGFDVV